MPIPKNNLLFGLAPKLTEEQKVYVDAIFDKKIIFCNAPSGSGKTTLAVAAAKLLDKPLYYVFSPTQEHILGFLPGDKEEKEKVYTIPLRDALYEIGEQPDKSIHSVDFTHPDAWVHAESHVYMRGINLKNCTVILDESQNYTVDELKKVLTRVHDTCTVIVIGHTGQIDLQDPLKSGFERYLEHFREKSYCSIVELTVNFRGEISKHADRL